MAFVLIFALLSGCFLAALVGMLGRRRTIGFGWPFVLSLVFTPLVGLILVLLSEKLPNGEKWVLQEHIGEMLACCAELLEERDAFLVLNLYSMGLSSTLARTAVRQTFGEPQMEQYGELTFTDRAGKELPLGTYYRFKR